MQAELRSLSPFGVRLISKTASKAQDLREIPVAFLREEVRKHRILVMRGFLPLGGADAFAEYCARWGEVSEWPFGKVLELVEHENPADHIFDHSYMPLHWDGMYRPQIPEFQIFQCVKAPPLGSNGGPAGRTTFSNTPAVLEAAQPNLRALWSRVTGTYRRKMEFYDSKVTSPIVARHPTHGFGVIRYNEPPRDERGERGEAQFVNPSEITFTGIAEDDVDEFHRTLRAALYNPNHYYAHTWQEGDIVVTDNYSLLHGREEFVTRTPRHLRRVHVLGSPPLCNTGLESYNDQLQ